MRDLSAVEWEEFYSTGKHNLADDFYGPAIARATLIERAVGYFRSTAYLLMYEEFCDFLRNGGKIKVICSPQMHRDDIATVHDAAQAPSHSEPRNATELLSEIADLSQSEPGKLHLSLLGGMLRFGLAEIKIALTSDGDGIFHEKIGILHDGQGNMLSFSGSANETLCGWGLHGNVESFDVFQGWQNGDKSRVRNHREAFLEAWEGRRPGVKTLDLDRAVKDKLLEEAPEDREELYRTIKTYQALQSDIVKKQRRAPSPAATELDEWPSGRSPERHQEAALQDWYTNKCFGIFKHATGSGKTFTGIHAVRDHVRTGKVALIVVPSKLLFNSWRNELRQEIPNATLMLAGSGNYGWKRAFKLEAFTSKTTCDDRRIILSTMQTASSTEFYRRLKNVDQILLVADEVHQLGSTEFRKLMLKHFGKRLGLSATPERFGDPEGTALLIEYFGGVVGGQFTLKDAMIAGRLVPYKYHPKFVYLTEFEREQWQNLTRQIRRLAAQSPRNNDGGLTPTLQMKKKLIARSRIAKKALNKIDAAIRILQEHYEPGQRWLIYCEDKEQMSDVSKNLRDRGFDPFVYHSSMDGDPQRTLDFFIKNGGIMIAIRCLDEGVDIPSISHAVILASSQNPRQFIQRRGRVLRVAEFKTKAYIWDTLVMPVDEDKKDEEIQDALTRAEILRALEFANNAMNQEEASRLRFKAIDLGIDFDTVYAAEEDPINEDSD